jgi:hypothetical protein
MQVRQIIKIVNEKLAGETLGLSELRSFLNDVIYDINSAMSAKFLSFDGLTEDDSYNCFPDNYITSVVTIGAAYKFYMTDEEGIDSAQAYGLMYRNNLFYMVRDYSVRIPDEYKDWDNTGFLKSSVGSLTPEMSLINIFSGTGYTSESLNPDIRYIQGLKGDKGDKGDPGEVTLEYLKNNYYSISEIDEKLSSFSNSITGIEHTLNKVNTISTESTDSQYPSVEAVVKYLDDNYYNALETDNILNDISNNILTRELSTNKIENLLEEVTPAQYPSAKATIDFVNKKFEQIHTHSNKGVLDSITPERVAQWDAGGSGGGITEEQFTAMLVEYLISNVINAKGINVDTKDWNTIVGYDWNSFGTKTSPKPLGDILNEKLTETQIKELLAGAVDLGYVNVNQNGRINTPKIYISGGYPSWAGLVEYDENGKETTMEQTLATKSDKTDIVEGGLGTSITLAHNTEYRIGGIPNTFEFVFPSSLEIDYISSVVFSTESSAPVLTYPDGMHWSGDDLSDGKFVPVASKHYTVAFWYDGVHLNGAVRGVKL